MPDLQNVRQSPSEPSLLSAQRARFHRALIEHLLVIEEDRTFASNGDKDNEASRQISLHIATKLGAKVGACMPAQSADAAFEPMTKDFLEATFFELNHLRPGDWLIKVVKSSDARELADFDQYSDLLDIKSVLKKGKSLKAIMGSDLMISPDIIIARNLENDASINRSQPVVDDRTALLASLRASNNGKPILHANVSCKWTIRPDRSQIFRSEALKLIRSRKGRVPHIAIVTGEPLPSRLASVALGTGDIDCVYHFALQELVEAVDALGQSEASEMLAIMIEGRRLRDIADLPLDLAT